MSAARHQHLFKFLNVVYALHHKVPHFDLLGSHVRDLLQQLVDYHVVLEHVLDLEFIGIFIAECDFLIFVEVNFLNLLYLGLEVVCKVLDHAEVIDADV